MPDGRWMAWRKRSSTRGGMSSRSSSSRPVFWASRRITTDSPYCVGMVEIRTSIGVLRTLMCEAAVLRQALFGDIETGHQLQAQHQRRGDLGVGLGLHMQHAVDAEADEQRLFLRLDVDVRGARLQRFLEHRLSSLTTGASSAPGVTPSTSPNSTGMSPISGVSSLARPVISSVRR